MEAYRPATRLAPMHTQKTSASLREYLFGVALLRVLKPLTVISLKELLARSTQTSLWSPVNRYPASKLPASAIHLPNVAGRRKIAAIRLRGFTLTRQIHFRMHKPNQVPDIARAGYEGSANVRLSVQGEVAVRALRSSLSDCVGVPSSSEPGSDRLR